MNEPAQFILSLDCEGKWGMADDLRPCHDLLTNDALLRAYEQIVALFERYSINATFAFVMAFVLSPEERERFRDELLGTADPWLRPYRDAVAGGRLDGWHQPLALELVRSAKTHEIACHSFCHRSLSEQEISAAGAEAELNAALGVARLKGLSLETFVFPRNRPGHFDALRSHGFIGYRERLPRPKGRIGRALSMFEELNVLARAQHPAAIERGLVPIPSGRFLNWRSGLRSAVPGSVTQARWRHQLRAAAQTGGIVHLWMHPHNLVTGSGTANLLERVLRDVADMRDNGELRVLTQRDYCVEQRNASIQ